MSIPSLTNNSCPYCQLLCKPDAEVVVCSACGKLHHRDCWQQHQRCSTRDCTGVPFLQSGAVGSEPSPAQPATTSIPPLPPMDTQRKQPMYPAYQAAIPDEIILEGYNTLIIRDRGSFPPVCVATRKTENLVQRKRTESWAASWVLLLILLIGPLITAIVYFCVRKTGRIQFYLEKEYARKRTKILIGNWCLFLGTLIGAFIAFDNNTTVALGVVLLITSIIVPAIIYFVFIQLYTVTKIQNGYLWCKFRNKATVDALYAAACKQQQL